MRVAAGQFSAGTDISLNLSAISVLIGKAADVSAELLVLPESSMYASPEPPPDAAVLAQNLDGPFIRDIAVLAREAGLGVVVGMMESRQDGAPPYNTLVALDVRGGISALYRKIHLYDAFGYSESAWTSAGPIAEPQVLDIGGFRAGMLTCYDLRFPESARFLVDAGANVLLLPAMWIAGPGKEDHWNTLVRARAIENTSYVVAANQCGPLATGYSMIVDPFGVVMANAGEGAGLVFADLDLTRLADVRLRIPSLGNRRFKVLPG
ncbi:carbon-nitrogen hydrolase family protein [Arthrobacter sp. D1-29]